VEHFGAKQPRAQGGHGREGAASALRLLERYSGLHRKPENQSACVERVARSTADR
jgi:hypothetical protein